MTSQHTTSLWQHLTGLVVALLVVRFVVPWVLGWSADSWLRGDVHVQRQLAAHLVQFEASDDVSRHAPISNRFAGEAALVTHQMTALGLGQMVLAHPELKQQYLPIISRSAQKSFLPEQRDFGTRAWHGQDAIASLDSGHGHAYMGYPALAVGMARLLGAPLPATLVREHDRLIEAFIVRLSHARCGLIETYPGEAYPTDVAAVAGAIALHGRATGQDHSRVLRRWSRAVIRYQVHGPSGFVYQRMGAVTCRPHDAPRGSGTALAAYFAGFADKTIRRRLAGAVTRHVSTFLGLGGVREYAEGFGGAGDVDSGPVLLGVSVSATGFALSVCRNKEHRDTFTSLMRTTTLFGVPVSRQGRSLFAVGGPIGNALMLALLTSGPEVAP